jgi:hypothetical protein
MADESTVEETVEETPERPTETTEEPSATRAGATEGVRDDAVDDGTEARVHARPDPRALTELIEEMVDKGATTAEQIHREIADLPLGVLERIGLFERTAGDVRNVQQASIGAVYGLIRDVNHHVSQLAGELLGERRDRT